MLVRMIYSIIEVSNNVSTRVIRKHYTITDLHVDCHIIHNNMANLTFQNKAHKDNLEELKLEYYGI